MKEYGHGQQQSDPLQGGRYGPSGRSGCSEAAHPGAPAGADVIVGETDASSSPDAALVTLRDWRLEDLDVYAHWTAPGHRWQDFDGPYFPKPTPEEQAEELERRRAAILAGNWPEPRRRLVVADAATDAMLGTVSWYWLGKETNWLALGILIFDPERWGRGLGAAALRQWCDYLWTAMPQLARLDLETWSGNTRMMRLAEKLGFRLEARYRKARVVDGVYHDAVGYGVLREEWAGAAQ